MKTWMILLSAFVTTSVIAEELDTVRDPEEITYEWLVNAGSQYGYSDHIPHFREIFSHLKVRTLLEFGLGYSTKYFMDHCNKVISVEFVTHGSGPDWIKSCLELYRESSNWVPITYFSGWQGDMSWAPYKYMGSESVYKAASYQCSIHKDYALIDNFYLVELGAFIGSLAKYNSIDVAFVDAGIYIRGDMVQLLFGKVPVILAHDTYVRANGVQDDVYGYSRITTPEDYEEIFIPLGQGTTAWIKKDEKFRALTEELQRYAKGL